MTVTILRSNHYGEASEAYTNAASKTKIIFITFLFLLSLLAFVVQTEFTSQAYQLGFNEPIVLLFVTHGSWWVLWPIQAISITIWRTWKKYRHQKNDNGTGYQILVSHSQTSEQEPILSGSQIDWIKYFKKTFVKQLHNVYHTSILIYEANVNDDKSTDYIDHLIDRNPHISSTSSITDCFHSLFKTPAFKYISFKTFLITIVLTTAGLTWYASMAMTYASDVTAIYNCSAFTTYLFAIPLLKEKFSWLKASSVIIAISGVFVVAYSDDNSSVQKRKDEKEIYPYRFWGNLIILLGAILYGYYEVLYKKYTCIPPHLTKLITPRRQSTFANFVMCLLGLYTSLIVLGLIVFAQIFRIHDFNFFNYGDNTSTIWGYIGGSIVSNMLFSGSFLSLMALTNPVLSSVGSLLTIFLIGIVEWVIFGNKLSLQQLFGDFLVIMGFVLLTIASWKEISEGKDDDDVENVSTYSFAVSTDG